MTLNAALLNALSGLQVNQSLLGVASQNVSNVNTPGYTRKIGTQEAVVLGGMGAGVDISSISRSVNEYLVRDLRTQGAALGSEQVLDQFYQNLQNLFGTPGSDSAIGAQVNALGDAFQALATTPEDPSQQISVVSQARFAADQLNSLAGQVQNLRQQADNDISDKVDEINTQLDAIATLNVRIAREQAAGQTTADLEDQRDLALGTLSQIIDVSYFTRDTGETVVYAPGGGVLVDATAHPLSHSPTAQMSESLSWADGTVGPILLNGTDITGDLTSGTLGGLVQMRDTILPNLAAQFDELATALTDQINAAHNQGTAFPGAASLTGSRSFAAADLPGFSGSARFTVTDGTGTVVATTDVTLTGATTIGTLLSDINTGLGGAATASLNSSGQIVIQPASGSNSIAVNELDSQAADGSVTRGLSDFLGLNDFFATDSSYSDYRSAQQSSKTAALGLSGTLTVSGAGFAPVDIAYTAGDSLQSIAAAINADATLGTANVTASVATDGSGFRLVLSDADVDNMFLSDSGSLVSSLDLKSRAPASALNVAVRSDIVADPGKISAATLSSGTLGVGDVAVTPGDNSTAQAIANAFNQRVSFSATGQLAAGNRTLSEYGGAILSLDAAQAKNASDQVAWRNSLYQTLSNKATAQSGVNLDEEMGNIILLQNAYAASARVITTTSQLFDILMNIRT